MTHGVDFNQHYVQLNIEQSEIGPSDAAGLFDQTMEVRKPDDANVCPPGWYMLFVVSASGIPSVGRFVHVP
jgi:hypothetical protein